MGGQARQPRPLSLAYVQRCIFQRGVQVRLDVAGIPWVLAVGSDNRRRIEASVSADMAVHTVLDEAGPPQVVRNRHGGTLPELARVKVNLDGDGPHRDAVVRPLAELIRTACRTVFHEATVDERENRAVPAGLTLERNATKG